MIVNFEKLVDDYNKAKADVRRYLIKIEEFREESSYPNSPKLDGMPVAKSQTSSVEAKIIKLFDYQEELEKLETLRESLRNDVERCIALINDYHDRDIVRFRVFQDMGWRKIGRRKFCSHSTAKNVYLSAIANIDRKLECENYVKN